MQTRAEQCSEIIILISHGWIMEKNVNTELEQFGVNVSEGVIHLFSGVF